MRLISFCSDANICVRYLHGQFNNTTTVVNYSIIPHPA